MKKHIIADFTTSCCNKRIRREYMTVSWNLSQALIYLVVETCLWTLGESKKRKKKRETYYSLSLLGPPSPHNSE